MAAFEGKVLYIKEMCLDRVIRVPSPDKCLVNPFPSVTSLRGWQVKRQGKIVAMSNSIKNLHITVAWPEFAIIFPSSILG